MDFDALLTAWKAGDRPAPPIVELLGIELTDFGEGTATLHLNAERRHHNAMGTLHGGVVCDLADVAIGVAMATRLATGESFTTLTLSATYLRAVREGRLRAEATVVRRGRTTAYCECDVIDDESGEPIAKLTSSCVVLEPKPGLRNRT